jgi:hypothetical protein
MHIYILEYVVIGDADGCSGGLEDVGMGNIMNA